MSDRPLGVLAMTCIGCYATQPFEHRSQVPATTLCIQIHSLVYIKAYLCRGIVHVYTYMVY